MRINNVQQRTMILEAATSSLAICILLALVFSRVILFSSNAVAQTEDAMKYEAAVAEEMSYREQVDSAGKSWAEDLMFMYRWKAKYLTSWKNGPQFQIEEGDFQKRFHSELAWLTISGQGLLATYDFKHGHTTLAGSTSRFVSTLFLSKNFWLEVRAQCRDIRDLRQRRLNERGRSGTPEPLASCAERVRSDISTSQLIGSNVSLFVTGGIVAGIGKKLFVRYATNWFVARVLPLIPMGMRSKWVASALVAAAIILPPAVLYAGIAKEHESNKSFYENLELAIKENSEQMARESVLKASALETEREVFELALWIGANLPAGGLDVENGVATAESRAADFAFRLQTYGPYFAKLKEKRGELETRRESLEAELGAIPNISARLMKLAEQRRVAPLKGDDATLFRQAQYLASLRLVLRSLPGRNP